MKRWQAVVETLQTRAIALLFTPTAQQCRRARVLRIVGGQHAAFAGRSQVLGGIKTEASDIAHGARAPAAIFGAVGLSGVLNDDQLVASRDIENRIHFGALPVEMHQQDGARAAGDRSFDFGGVDVACRRVDIDENRRGADVPDGGHRGVKGEWNGDYFVAGLNAGRQQRQMERTGSGVDGHPVPRAAITGEFLFQRGHFLAADELPAFEYAPNRRGQFRF